MTLRFSFFTWTWIRVLRVALFFVLGMMVGIMQIQDGVVPASAITSSFVLFLIGCRAIQSVDIVFTDASFDFFVFGCWGTLLYVFAVYLIYFN